MLLIHQLVTKFVFTLFIMFKEFIMSFLNAITTVIAIILHVNGPIILLADDSND